MYLFHIKITFKWVFRVYLYSTAETIRVIAGRMLYGPGLRNEKFLAVNLRPSGCDSVTFHRAVFVMDTAYGHATLISFISKF